MSGMLAKSCSTAQALAFVPDAMYLLQLQLAIECTF